MREEPRRDPWQGWKGFAIALGTGVAIVFAWQMVDLLGFLAGLDGGMEEGAIWAMLLMIAATMGTVVVIGGGLFRAIRREGRREADPGDGARPRG